MWLNSKAVFQKTIVKIYKISFLSHILPLGKTLKNAKLGHLFDLIVRNLAPFFCCFTVIVFPNKSVLKILQSIAKI